MNNGSSIRIAIGTMRREIALSPFVHSVTRHRLLRRLGWGGIGDCFIAPGCRLLGAAITIADGAYLNYEVLVDAVGAPVHIGRNVHIGQRTMLITGTHEIGDSQRRAGENVNAPIVIGEGAWLGAGVIVLPGVKIGAGAVIGAGSVVTQDVPASDVRAGAPAQRLRNLDHCGGSDPF